MDCCIKYFGKGNTHYDTDDENLKLIIDEPELIQMKTDVIYFITYIIPSINETNICQINNQITDKKDIYKILEYYTTIFCYLNVMIAKNKITHEFIEEAKRYISNIKKLMTLDRFNISPYNLQFRHNINYIENKIPKSSVNQTIFRHV